MSATEQMRQMISELMGTDPSADSETHRLRYSDHQICRSFLLGCCPNEILNGTRMDLGDCPKVHDLALRADYEKAQRMRDHYYDIDALEHLERFFAECDKKTEFAKRRLAETQEVLSNEVAEKADVVLTLNEEIGKTLAKAEQLGSEGKVEESLKMMEEVDSLRKSKSDAEQDYRGSMPASSYQQQKLRVCDVCSAYLGIHDNDRRLADHFGGKLHMGFVFLRERLAEYRATEIERRTQKEAARFEKGYYTGGSSAVGMYEPRGRDDYDQRRRSRSRDRDRRRRSRSGGSRKRCTGN